MQNYLETIVEEKSMRKVVGNIRMYVMIGFVVLDVMISPLFLF